jgi:hypothetical protein
MKFKIIFDGSTSSQHLYAVKKLFANLQGVEVASNTPDSYIIEALGEDIVRVIEDMDLLGYITIVRL